MSGPAFREIRRRMRVTQADLGKLIGAHRVSVVRYEKRAAVPARVAVLMRLLDERRGLR